MSLPRVIVLRKGREQRTLDRLARWAHLTLGPTGEATSPRWLGFYVSGPTGHCVLLDSVYGVEEISYRSLYPYLWTRRAV